MALQRYRYHINNNSLKAKDRNASVLIKSFLTWLN